MFHKIHLVTEYEKSREKEQRQSFLHMIEKSAGAFMKPQVIPRFRIEGRYYRMEELSEKQVREILEKRLEKAMEAIHYKKKS